MDEDSTSIRRLSVAVGVCVWTFFGLTISSLLTEPEEQPEDVKIVYVPADDRGDPGPARAPTREDVDAAIDAYCATDERCGDR